MPYLIKNRINGFTIVELLLIVGFIMFAFIGIYIAYQKISFTSLVDSETSSMKKIMIDIQPIISTGNKVELDSSFLQAYGILDKNTLQNDYYINKLGSQMTFSSLYSLTTQRITHLKVTYVHMNKEFCSQLVNKYAPYADFISVGLYVIKNTMNETEQIQYEMANAFEKCEKAAFPNNDFPMIISFNTQISH